MAGTKRYSSIVNTSDAYRISTDPAQLDLALIHRFLSQESYWAQNVPLATVQRAIANSLCFGLYEAERQIGFARCARSIPAVRFHCSEASRSARGKARSERIPRCLKLSELSFTAVADARRPETCAPARRAIRSTPRRTGSAR